MVKLIFLFFACILLSGCNTDDSVVLHLRFKPGDRFRIDARMDIYSKSGKQTSTRTIQDFETKRVREPLRFSAHTVRIVHREQIGEKSILIDTDKPHSDTSSRTLRMYNKMISEIYPRKSIIQETTRYGDVVAPFCSFVSGFTFDSVNVSSFQVQFPNYRIRTGNTWTDDGTYHWFRFRTKSEYRVEKITNQDVTISVSSTRTKNDYENIEGSITVDRKSGQILSIKYVIKSKSGKRTDFMVKGTSLN